MSEGGLKKEFKESDLSRIRNLITGKYGEKSKTSVGFEKRQEKHVEGDVWEENGKTWTIINGIKQTVSKLDSMKKLVQFPLVCPECNNPMKSHPLNKKMYNIHGKCADCVIQEETRLKIEGGFKEYKNNLMNKNKVSALTELEDLLEEYLNVGQHTFINENGDEEVWQGGDIDTSFVTDMKEKIKKEKDKQS